MLQEQWEVLSQRLVQTQEQIRACESAMVFAFVEVKLQCLLPTLFFFLFKLYLLHVVIQLYI